MKDVMINIAELLSDMISRGAKFWIGEGSSSLLGAQRSVNGSRYQFASGTQEPIIEFLKNTGGAVSQGGGMAGRPIELCGRPTVALEQIEPLGGGLQLLLRDHLKGKLDSKSLASRARIVDRHESCEPLYDGRRIACPDHHAIRRCANRA